MAALESLPVPRNYSAAVCNASPTSPTEMKIALWQSRGVLVLELEVRYYFNTPKNLSFIMEEEAWADYLQNKKQSPPC